MIRPSLIAIALVAPSAQPQVQRADFSVCVMINPGPLHPQKHIGGTAPVSPLT